jgi:hypothetical protein
VASYGPIDLPDEMEVEVDRGIPLVAKTVADLRSLSPWPPGLILVVSRERWSVARVERP